MCNRPFFDPLRHRIGDEDLPGAVARSRNGRLPADPLLDIRWDKVLCLRRAIAASRYDINSRLADLLEDPPDELLRLAWS